MELAIIVVLAIGALGWGLSVRPWRTVRASARIAPGVVRRHGWRGR